MSTLSANTKQDIERTTRKFQDASNDATHTIREVAHDAGSKVREFVDQNSEKANELRKTAEAKISENPMKSVAIAALSGLVLGALLRR